MKPVHQCLVADTQRLPVPHTVSFVPSRRCWEREVRQHPANCSFAPVLRAGQEMCKDVRRDSILQVYRHIAWATNRKSWMEVIVQEEHCDRAAIPGTSWICCEQRRTWGWCDGWRLPWAQQSWSDRAFDSQKRRGLSRTAAFFFSDTAWAPGLNVSYGNPEQLSKGGAAGSRTCM